MSRPLGYEVQEKCARDARMCCGAAWRVLLCPELIGHERRAQIMGRRFTPQIGGTFATPGI